jgi:hypothetical protein
MNFIRCSLGFFEPQNPNTSFIINPKGTTRRQWLAMEGVKVVVCAALLASDAPNLA